MKPPALSVVIPVHNEAEVLPELHRRIVAVLDSLGLDAEVLYVDDGSRDGTPGLLGELAGRDPRARPITLTRNFGHQAAIGAGLDRARGDAVVVMDGDLQDPPELIPAFLDAWRAGAEVVYAVRQGRKEGPAKRLAYWAFYRLWRAVSDVEIPLDSGDFGLMDRKVVEALRGMPEQVRFVRGLRAYAGFRQVGVPYDRDPRAGGRPKYTAAKLFRLAADGLISFSGRPLRLATYLGLAAAAIALALTAWVIWDAVAQKTGPRGWASTMVVVLFMGSVQLVSLGIIGEYLRLIFLESKRRPAYLARPERDPGAEPGDPESIDP